MPPCERPEFDSLWRSYQQISLPPRAARYTSGIIRYAKWVPDNTGADSGSSTMRVAPIDYHWWYDRRLRTYHPGLVGHTQVNWVDETSVQLCIVSFLGTLCKRSDLRILKKMPTKNISSIFFDIKVWILWFKYY